jgi:hypothetical protein
MQTLLNYLYLNYITAIYGNLIWDQFVNVNVTVTILSGSLLLAENKQLQG